jgi:glycosyltransferase involved in cell wall biosynthesis
LNLPFTLESLRGWANRVFVVDSGSTDRTAEIARSYGATVVERKWKGYAAQKNWALENLPFESTWILILDADEAVTPELRDEIQQVVSRPPNQVRESGFYINRVFIFMGRQIRHCGYFPSWNLRLFKRGHARYEDRQVHEHMITSGEVGFLRHLLLHEDRRGLEHFLAKHNRYSTLEAEEVYASRERWPGLYNFFFDRLARRRFLKQKVLPHLPLPLLWRMFYMYVVRLGFLDGRAGWNLCTFISSYEFHIHAKYQDLKRLGGRVPAVANALSVPEGHGVRQTPRQQAHAAVLAAAPPTDMRMSSPAIAPARTASVEAAPPAAGSAPETVSLSQDGKPRRAGKVPVSVLIPTLNEASNMSRCLDHLEWADEVVVVDSGSKDDTCRIAEAYGAHVVNFKWNGQWPKKKNWALRNVPFKHEWVLIVDADEWITPELAEEIERAIRSDRHVGYYVNRRFIFMGQWIRHCGYYPSWNLRLIKRGHGEYEQLTGIDNTGSGDNEVHEHVLATGPVGHLNSDMLHFAFPSIHVFMEKHNRYSNWEAAVQFKGVERESAVVGSAVLSKRRRLKNISRRMPFRPTLRFLYSYIFKGGFLDGRAGLVFCRLLAIYEYLSVAKYHELRWAEEDRRQARQLSAVPSLNRAAGGGQPAQARETAIGTGAGGGT